jgi:hypothetical protein
MELLYISDISQLDYLMADKPEMLEGRRPVCSDMVVAFELEKSGIEFIDVWDYLDPDDIKNNADTARFFSLNWLNDEFAGEDIGSLTHAEVAHVEMIWPFEACLNAQTAYSRIFNRFPVKKISGFFHPQVAIIRTGPFPASRAVCSVAEAVLFSLAGKNGIVIDKLELDATLANTKS